MEGHLTSSLLNDGPRRHLTVPVVAFWELFISFINSGLLVCYQRISEREREEDCSICILQISDYEIWYTDWVRDHAIHS